MGNRCDNCEYFKRFHIIHDNQIKVMNIGLCELQMEGAIVYENDICDVESK